MEVDFLWEWGEVNNSRKLRQQDEEGGSVGTGPVNPSDISSKLVQWPSAAGLLFGQAPLADRLLWSTLHLEAIPASSIMTNRILAGDPPKKIISYAGNYLNSRRDTITRYRKSWRSHLNDLLVIRACDCFYLPHEG